MIPRNAILELMRNAEIVVDCPPTVDPFKRVGRNVLLRSWPGFLNCRLVISIEEPFSAAEKAYGSGKAPIRVKRAVTIGDNEAVVSSDNETQAFRRV